MICKKTITGLIVTVLLIVLLRIGAEAVFANEWTYPLDRTLDRPSLKSFGEYFDKNSYLGKEAIFPNQFTGYHAGTDLEILPGEENVLVSVAAVTSGTIIYIGPVSGYGGLILLKVDSEDKTFLYGHLDLSKVKLLAGDRVLAGDIIAYLGNAFSTQIGGERKHLHFGLYLGHDLYFKGYENTLGALNSRWIDPVKYITGKMAAYPTTIGVMPTQAPMPTPTTQQGLFINLTKFFESILSWIQRL